MPGHLECAMFMCSVSMGALGSSAALRAAAATSLSLSNGLQATHLRSGLPMGLPASLPRASAPQPGSARPASAAPASTDLPPQSQPLAKGAPQSCIVLGQRLLSVSDIQPHCCNCGLTCSEGAAILPASATNVRSRRPGAQTACCWCAGSPASSLSSAGSLFNQKAPTLPPGWLQLKDPEGRSFFMHAATQQTTWTFPVAA